MSVRVRFAPSPTGYLHIGGARTALFNWLYARHTGGTFVLRIEDTDAARNSQEAVDVILNGLRWLGLDWDEGPTSSDASGPSKGDCGPYFQSKRGAIYRKRIDELLSNGRAYEHEGAIKFRMERAPITIPDLVVGDVVRNLTDREEADPDFVIVRSDGQPVFHLVNVIDDLEMKITHVIRGEDHLSNTSKHIALFRAFGVEPPKYAHIPLILNPDASKMSKRDQGASLTSYVDELYVPEAVVNYLYLLGWSPKENREIMPLDEVIASFDLPQILRHNARFDLTKLQWLNYEYLRTIPVDRYEQLGRESLRKAGIDLTNFASPYVQAAFATARDKAKQLPDLPGFTDFYFKDSIDIAPEILTKDFSLENRPRIERLRAAFSALVDFTAPELEKTLKTVAAELGVKAGVLVHPVRMACTGRNVGPSLYHLLEVLGKARVLQRLDQALATAS